MDRGQGDDVTLASSYSGSLGETDTLASFGEETLYDMTGPEQQERIAGLREVNEALEQELEERETQGGSYGRKPGSADTPAPRPSAPKDSRSQQLNENERGNPNAANATDPNWGRLTESLQDVLAPLADRNEWTKWDKIIEDRNARAMEDMTKMAREAFAFYPTKVVEVFINKRGWSYSEDAQVRLLKMF